MVYMYRTCRVVIEARFCMLWVLLDSLLATATGPGAVRVSQRGALTRGRLLSRYERCQVERHLSMLVRVDDPALESFFGVSNVGHAW